MISSAVNVDRNLYEGVIEYALDVMQLLFKNIDHTADVFFVFEENGEKIRIPAHKNILAMGSSVFDDMFYGPDKHFIDGDIPTRSTTITAKTFEAFISLFYGKWGLITKENCADVLRMAENFGAKHCIEMCEQFQMKWNSDEESIDR